MANPNKNCLRWMKCPNPKCGDPYGPFDIQGLAVFEVFDDGTSTHKDIEWEDDSWAMCQHCQTETTVGGLRNAGK